MRLIIFLLAVLALPFILWRCSTKGDGLIKNAIEKTTGTDDPAQPSPSVSEIQPQNPPQPSPIVANQVDLKDPQESRIYQFRMRQAPAADSLSQLSPDCRFMVDPITQSVSITGPQAEVLNSIDFLRKIDLPAKTCAVSCWVVFVDNRKSKGYDFTATFTNILKGIKPDILSSSIGDGSLVFNAKSSNIDATLGIVADGAAVEVIQRPQIMLTNGVPATIESLSEVPLPASSVSNGVSQSSVDYRKVGLALRVTPYFIGEQGIRLAITQTNGLIGSFTQINGADVPQIESQTVQSTIELELGQSILLGGLQTSRKRNSVGILRKNDEAISGLLYVVIATHPNHPKAYPVEGHQHAITPPQISLPDPSMDIWEILLPKKATQ